MAALKIKQCEDTSIFVEQVTRLWHMLNVKSINYGTRFFLIFMHFCPGTMTTHAINSDRQRGLDRRLRHTHNIAHRTEPVSH